MATEELHLPLIYLSGYINPKVPEDRERIIAEVRAACAQYGFFQATGHNIPLGLQKGLLKSIGTLFDMPKEEKCKLSFLKNMSRRGYKESGMSLREGDELHDSKELYYPVVEHAGFYGPNVWSTLPEEQFRNPFWDYCQATHNLGLIIWEILLQGLGHPTSLMDTFAKKPVVVMKMIRYPPLISTLPGQFTVGAHTQCGGVNVLIQEPEKHGLEVWLDEKEKWVPVKAIEDVDVINCGDIVMRWSGGQYKSAMHRVINKADKESRLLSATFFNGDIFAANPLNLDDPVKETVGQLLIKKVQNQFSLTEKLRTKVQAAERIRSMPASLSGCGR